MKNLLIWMLTGALLGGAVASFVVPPALSWYSAPGGLPEGTQIQALVQIPEVIHYATGKLIRGQAIGVLLGAIVGGGVGLAVRRRRPTAPAANSPDSRTRSAELHPSA